MKLSTKGRYGLRTLIDIVLHQEEGPVPLHQIAARQAISVKYLWQVLNPLRSAGLISVTRGARGGYRLALAPEQLTLFEIVSTIEGPVAIVDCLGAGARCPRARDCTAHWVWAEVNQRLADVLRGITLAEIVQRARQSGAEGGR